MDSDPQATPSPLALTADLTALKTLEDGQPPVPLVLVNSLGWAREGELVEVVVSRADVKVVDSAGRAVLSQVGGLGWWLVSSTVDATMNAHGLKTEPHPIQTK